MRAVTERGPVDPPASPDVAVRTPEVALWGTGTACRVELPAPWPQHVGRVAEVLASVAREVRGGPAPAAGALVALGALPFDTGAPASLVVPRRLVGHGPDGWWTTTVLDGPADAHDEARDGRGSDRRPAPLPDAVTVRPVRDPAAWCGSVAAATEEIRAGALTKVVLARELEVTATTPFDPAAVLDRLATDHPHALRYLVDGFVGASPELLVARLGETVRAQPMAGTTPRTGDAAVDGAAAAELRASAKNRAEHQITIDMVHETVLPWCSYLDAEPEPSVVDAGPVQHLATTVEGRLSQPLPSVLDLVAALHPTPAVGGWPVQAALSVRDRLEGADRGRYAGPVGWVDAEGNGEFAVGIRGAELDGTRARVFVGVGVVADSDPAAELAETEAKARAVLGALARR